MQESLIGEAIEQMERDSFFMLCAIYQNRNISPFIREILKERINIHKVVFYRIKEMRILFNREKRISQKLGVLKIKIPKFKVEKTTDFIQKNQGQNNDN